MIRTKYIDQVCSGEDCRLSALISWENEHFTLTFNSRQPFGPPSGDMLYAAMLMPALCAGHDLCIEAPVSPLLLESTDLLLDYLLAWHPHLRRIRVEAPVAPPATRGYPPRTAAFFTGGVDSFYTLINRREALDALIYVHGFDIPLDNHALRSLVSRRLNETADRFNIRLIEVETNYREFSDRFAAWGPFAHGAALASVAHLSSGQFDRVFIPSTASLSTLTPLGSHPLIDPLWSSDSIRIVHDGCNMSRSERLERIIVDPRVRDALRVCWENPENAYNCGLCEKCTRTMLVLEALGVLGQCPTFPARLTRDQVEAVCAETFLKRIYAYDNLALLKARSARTDLQIILTAKLWPYRNQDPAHCTAVLYDRPRYRWRSWLCTMMNRTV